MNFKNLFKKKKNVKKIEQFTVSKIIREFGKSISYEEIIKILPSFSREEQEEIKNGIYEEQKAFWNSPEMVRYYTEDHPKLPPVPAHFKRLLETIEVQNGEIIVDLGCGVGALIQRILKEGRPRKIIGIDYAPSILAQCKKNLGSYIFNTKMALIEHNLMKGIPLKNESVDKCVSNWGIFYFSKECLRGIILPEIYRVLKPGGSFICSVIIQGANLARLRKIFSLREAIKKRELIKKATRFGKDLEMLFPAYSIEELKSMLEDGGFVIENFYLTLYGGSVTFVSRKIH